MFITKKFAIMFLLLLSVGSVVWSQVLPAPPTVYVSGGATIYSVNVATGAVTPIFTSPNVNSNFESLAVGPDNVDVDGSGNAAHLYLLYACDTATNSIIRFDPTAALPITPQPVASLGFSPMCGRSTATGDFYVTNKSGPGVYQLIYPANAPPSIPLANVSFSATALAAGATQIDTSKNMTGRGLAQKYIGDLLAVDNAGNQVLHSVYPPLPQPQPPPPLFGTLSPLITSKLNGPVGVVNAPSLRQIFVSNSNSVVSKATPAEPAVSIFDATGAPSTTTCPSGLSIGRSKEVPGFLATAPTDQFPAKKPNTLITDTIYLVTSGNSGGTLWTWNNTAQAGKCNLVSVATAKATLSGVAVPPAPVTLTLPVAANVPTNFIFNSNLFQLTTSQNCTNNPPTATVTAYPFSLATVNSMIGLEPKPHNSQTPSVNLGDGGFQTLYESYNPQCGAADPLTDTAVMLIANFVDSSQSTNPRYLDCHNSDQAAKNSEPKLGGVTACEVAPTLGSYPIGGPIAGDYGGKLSNFFAMVNEAATSNVNNTTNPPGVFCGFEPPLTGDAMNGINLPNPPPVLTGNSITVKFKVADLSQGGTCQSGPYLNNQTALLSVAQICNTTPSNDPFCGPGGSPVFNDINPNNNATSSQPAVFTDTNNQFKFSLLLGGLAPGTYSLTVTFITDNTIDQSTLFVIP